MKLIKKLCFFLLLVTFFTSCGKKEVIIDEPKTESVPEKTVQQAINPKFTPITEKTEESEKTDEKSVEVSAENTENIEHKEEVEPEIQIPEKEPEKPKRPYKKDKKDLYDGFFEDSLFIGDSRSVGLMEYGKLGNPTAFCHTGLSVYNYDDKDLEIEGFGSISFEELLKTGSFDKIYIGLGINELGYKQEATIKEFQKLLDLIKTSQPSSNVYILANIHVTASRSKGDKVYNNENIDSLNSKLEELARNNSIKFLNANSLFDDQNGALDENNTGDNTHLYAKCYPLWSNFIYENSN